MSVRVVARIRARRERESTVEVALRGLLAPTRAEPGCLRYELFRSVEVPGEFLFDEEWRDEASIDAHMKSAHVSAMIAEAAPFLAEPPDIRRYPT